jgi:integrase
MVRPVEIPVGITLSTNVEYRNDRPKPFKARIRWVNAISGTRESISESFLTNDEAAKWILDIEAKANAGIAPSTAVMTLEEYGVSVMDLAMRGLEPKTLEPYMAGWRKLVVPTLGHIQVRILTNGMTDRAVHGWIADEIGRSSVKNALAALVRIAEQAVRDGLIDFNPCRITGWQRSYRKAAAETIDPRALALADFAALQKLADALVAASADERTVDRRTYQGWGDVVIFAACTATRIGEVSGLRVMDIDTEHWIWQLIRQTTPGPGGLQDKDPKSKRGRYIPIMEEIRPMVLRRIEAAGDDPMARLFTGPRGGRISTAVLRDATHWDDVVAELGYDHLRRHDLRHTGLTWMADAGVPVHVLRMIAGHGDLATTQRYLHPNHQRLKDAGAALNRFLTEPWSPNGPQSRIL